MNLPLKTNDFYRVKIELSKSFQFQQRMVLKITPYTLDKHQIPIAQNYHRDKNQCNRN